MTESSGISDPTMGDTYVLPPHPPAYYSQQVTEGKGQIYLEKSGGAAYNVYDSQMGMSEPGVPGGLHGHPTGEHWYSSQVGAGVPTPSGPKPGMIPSPSMKPTPTGMAYHIGAPIPSVPARPVPMPTPVAGQEMLMVQKEQLHGPVQNVQPENYSERSWKVMITFKPSELAKHGMDGVLQVPIKDLINPSTWREQAGFEWSDTSRIGAVTIRQPATNFWSPVSGRLFVPDPRVSSKEDEEFKFDKDYQLAKLVISDRMYSSDFIPGAKNPVQFTADPQDPRYGDAEIVLRETPKDTRQTFLETIGQGHLTESELRESVQRTPGTRPEDGHVILSKDTALGKFAQTFFPISPEGYYDKECKQIKAHIDNVDKWIKTLMSEQFETLTLGEFYNNAFIRLYPTYVNIAELEKKTRTSAKYHSPWSVIGDEVLPYFSNPKVRKQKEEEMLNKTYRFCATISMDILPMKKREEDS